MSTQRTLAIGFLVAGTAVNFYNSYWNKPQETETSAKGLGEFASKFNTILASLRWVGKGAKKLKSTLELKASTTTPRSWIYSPRTMQACIFVSGSIWLTYSNHQAFKPGTSLLNRAGSLALSWLGESNKIMKSHQLMTSLSKLIYNPRSHVRPLACAATMLVASHLASRYLKTP